MSSSLLLLVSFPGVVGGGGGGVSDFAPPGGGGGDADCDDFFYGDYCFLSEHLGATDPGTGATKPDVLDPCLEEL